MSIEDKNGLYGMRAISDTISEGRVFGRGRNQGNRPGAGPGGNCICPQCKTKVSHELAQPCFHVRCPTCGHHMIREL